MFAAPSFKLLKLSKLVTTSGPFVGRIHSASCLLKEAPPPAITDYYEILRIPKEATPSEVKEAYYKLSKLYHPDVKKDESSLAMFRKITEAYDVLGSVKSRQEYDQKAWGKKLQHDLNKEKFYVALYYKDKVAKPFESPVNEEIIRVRPHNDKFLEFETEDRRIEVQCDKEDSYEHRWDLLGIWGAERMFCTALFFYLFFSGLKLADQKFGLSLSDPKDAEITTKGEWTPEDLKKHRWTY